MLPYLPPLFFFAALMGSPVVGFLVFMGLGLAQIWQRRRSPADDLAFVWTREDTLLALCFMSIPLFKALSVLWSATPLLAWKSAFQHSYFLFWPLVILGLSRCKGQQKMLDRAAASGLLVYTAYAIVMQMRGTPISEMGGGRQNPGITAQIAMVVGSWNLLALTRKDTEPRIWRAVQAAAFAATFIIMVLTTRRLELLGFAVLSAGVVGYRLRRHLTIGRTALGLSGLAALIALLVYLRWDKFSLGFEQIAQYRLHGANTPDFTVNSWGIRLELWRVGWAAFMDHPWLGIGASARPYAMQAWGAPPPELFGHNHFHSHLIQTLVEGGLLGLLVLTIALVYSTRQMVLAPLKRHSEIALLAAAVLGAYVIEGTASATLHYDKANALLVVTTAWVWLQLRQTKQPVT